MNLRCFHVLAVVLLAATVMADTETNAMPEVKDYYRYRLPDARRAAMEEYGGMGSEAAVLRALRWLRKHQSDDGSWGNERYRPALTGLALLAYLGHGDTATSAEFSETWQKAVDFLLGSQTPEGHFEGRDSHDYTQPIVAFALCEAYGMTGSGPLRKAAAKAIAPIIRGQNHCGGFNYNLKGPVDTRNDLSYIAWCVQALNAAKMSDIDVVGLDACLNRAVAGVRRNYGDKVDGCGFGYSAPGRSGLTGAGVVCLQLLGRSADVEVKKPLVWLSTAKCSWNMEAVGWQWKRYALYYWYYVAQAMFHAGGDMWEQWELQMQPTLVLNQRVIARDASGYTTPSGVAHEIGSWTSPGTRGVGGFHPMLPTLLSVLMLETYYRYPPVHAVRPVTRISTRHTSGGGQEAAGWDASQEETRRQAKETSETDDLIRQAAEEELRMRSRKNKW